jgi:hypothetical protein
MSDLILIATGIEVVRVDADGSAGAPARGLEDQRPTGLSADPYLAGRAWCCTRDGGVFRSDDRGETWRPCGLAGERLMSIAPSPARADLIWAGCEPSAVWRSADAGGSWHPTTDLDSLPSSGDWAFPPRPDTHHVRWITCHPIEAGQLWVAIEAGALIRTADGGSTWTDRVPGGPYDTHELAVHSAAPEVLRSAAGDGYFESRDGGDSWSSPMDGLEVGYLRSVAIDPGDPETVLVSASTGPRTAYGAGRSDGRLFRREGGGRWERVRQGWPEPPNTIAPLLAAGSHPGELYAADERGVHRSMDGGHSWVLIRGFASPPDHLRGIAVVR